MERIKQHLPGLALGLSEHGFGLFAGTAVKDTSSAPRQLRPGTACTSDTMRWD